jgi:hypothetical protein
VKSAATSSRWFLFLGFFYPEDGGYTFFQNIGSQNIYTAPHLRRRYSSLKNSVHSWVLILTDARHFGAREIRTRGLSDCVEGSCRDQNHVRKYRRLASAG